MDIYEDPKTIENQEKETNAGNDDIYEDPIAIGNQENETNAGNDDIYEDPIAIGNQGNETNDGKVDNVYDTINIPISRNQREEDNSITISKKCLIILLLGVLVVIGATVALTYTLSKKNVDNGKSKTCGKGWLNISSECFKFVDDACQFGCSWEHSVDICKDLGGKLAEPRSDEIMQRLVDHAKQNSKLNKKAFWIGLTNTNMNGVFEWSSDKSPNNLNPRFWDTNEPTFDGKCVHTNPDTILLNDGIDFNQIVSKPVCQKSVKKDTGKCEKDWIARDGQCYKFMTHVCTDGCTWSEAKQICNKNHGHLTEGPDFQFLRNVAKSLKLKNNWWIGFSDLKDEGMFVRETDGKYTDLTDDFATGEPNNYNVRENCLEMRYLSDLKLNDVDCDIGYPRWKELYQQPLCQK
eukprot:GFUD01013137.1.p1 GENE.GFUD01013137.1~~GFUD01013137.1.p1  ORF type:complete len:407 (+),score=91.37 GFUD01013137.1:62-1282(+)